MASDAARRESADDEAVKIQLRAPKIIRDTIDRAADLLHVTRTEFMLRAAAAAAEETLLDQRLFVLNDAQFRKFEAALSAPPPNVDGLVKLLNKKPIWKE